ncbi:MAG: hypothetical protein ACI4IF_08100 [Acutalibacteraceae bacterium]
MITLKKKIALILAIVMLIVLLTPVKMYLKDGGSVSYKSLLYEVTKVHRLKSTAESTTEAADISFEDGIIIEILGITVYENIK